MILDESHRMVSESLRGLTRVSQKMYEGRDYTALGSSTSQANVVSLNSVHEMVPGLRVMAQEHPLMKRGAQLRHSYIFGGGIEVGGLSKGAEKIVGDTVNQQTVFSVDAQERLNLELYCAGNVFVFKNLSTNRFTHVPVEEIVEINYDDFDPSYVRYVRREWVDYSKNEKVSQWFPTSDFSKSSPRDRKIISQSDVDRGKEFPVNHDYVVYMKTSRAFAGSPLGMPDSFAGSLWAIAYSNYLSDSAALTNILKKVAWKLTNNSTREQAEKNAVIVGRPGGDGVGGTAALGQDQQLTSAGVPSAQVDFNGGQPLASMVATSLGVPVIALLSSPGATGGSYGAATTLDEPTRNGFKAEQDSWVTFFLEILRDLNPARQQDAVRVSFPSLDRDQPYRQLQSLAQAYATGAIFDDEYRETALDVLGVRDLHPGKLPTPPDFGGSDPIPRQGNTGAVPGGNDQGDTNHDNDNED